MNKYLKFSGSLIVASLLAGCGGGSDNATTPAESTSITIVDPYIEGATVFWDKDGDGVFDVGEPESTPSDSSGKATFNVKVTDGARIIMNTKGTHNGEAYTGTLTANYSSTGVVSPLTTLEEKGYTKTEIIALLATSGITLTEADITADPMIGLSSTNTTATDAALAKIQASVAINTFLDMRNMYSVDKKKTHVEAVKADLTTVATLMKDTITAANVSTSNADTMIKAAVAMGNYVISNPTDLATINTNKATIINNIKTALDTNKDAQVKIIDTTGTVSQLEGYGVSYGVSYVGNLNMTAQEVVSSLLNSNKSGLNIEYVKVGSSYEKSHPEYVKYNSNVNGTLFDAGYVIFWNGSNNSYVDIKRDWDNLEPKRWIVETGGASDGSTAPTTQVISNNKYRTKYSAEEGGFIPNDECTILSTKKVDKILDIEVDAIEVKTFCAYGNGDSYGIGESEWSHAEYNSGETLEQFINYVRDHSFGGKDLKLTNDYKVQIASSGEIISGSYWKVEDGILKTKYWDEIWYKVNLDTNMIDNKYIADSSFEYYGVTEAQAKQITRKMGLPVW